MEVPYYLVPLCTIRRIFEMQNYIFTENRTTESFYVVLKLYTCRVVLISPWSDQEGSKLMFLSEWHEFPSTLCPAKKKKLLTARVSMLLKSRASLTCFRACFIPARAKDLSAPQYVGTAWLYSWQDYLAEIFAVV